MAKELVLEPRLAVPESGAAGQVWGALVEAAQFGIAVSDFDARLRETNAAFANLVGYTAAELAELTLVDMCVEDEREVMVAALDALRLGSLSIAKFETTCQR